MKYERLTMVNNGFIDTNCRSCKQCKKVGRKYICNDMTACNEEIITRLAELEDKIERGELVENTVVTYVNMGRSDSKTLIDKALKYDELKAKIENGTLIETPCKVGDTVYALREDSFAEDNYKIMWHIAEGFVKKIYINKKNEIFLQIISWVDHKSWSKDSRNYKIKTFGQSVFLTKAEAEMKLKELKRE